MRHDLIVDLIGSLCSYDEITIRTMRGAQATHQDAQVIVNLCNSTYGTARGMPQVFLFNRNRRRQPFNVFQRWLLDLANKLAGIRTEALDIAALAFSINRVHCQRCLSRTAGTAKHGHLVTVYFRINRVEIVLPGTLYRDPPGEHTTAPRRTTFAPFAGGWLFLRAG